MRFVFSSLLTLLVSWAMITGCTVHRVKRDRKPPVKVPAKFSENGTDRSIPDRWWTSFSDAKLDAYVAQLLKKNLDLKQGFSRVNQAVALAAKAGAAVYPWVQVETGASYGQTAFYGGAQFGDQTLRSARFPIQLGISYEVDLWGKVASTRKAAKLDVRAGKADLSAMAMSLVGIATDLWFLIRELEAQKGLLLDQIKVNKTYLDLVELRFKNGLASALDVMQQRQQVVTVRAQLPLLEASQKVAQHQLDVLSGQVPGSVRRVVIGSLPTLKPLPKTGAPMDLLKRRPDVRAAVLRVLAADYRVGVAVADKLPALRLGASGGLNGNSISTLFTTWIFNLIGNLVAPLYQGGIKSAEVVRTRAALEERISAYGQVLLKAFQEVEDAIVREKKQWEHIGLLDQQRSAARETLGHAKDRYLRGQATYLAVLTALRSVQSVDRALLTAQRQLISYRINLYRALGGSWADSLRPQKPDAPSRKGATP